MAERAYPRGKNSPKIPSRATQAVTRPSLHDDVTAALETLGVGCLPMRSTRRSSVAERESLGHLEFLHRLLAGPAEAKQQRALERRIGHAHFHELTTLDGFDWAFNAKGLDRRAVEQLATCDFVRRRENVILVGQTGLGKSRILQSRARRLRPGIPGPLRDQPKLLQEFTAALADGTFAPHAGAYARFDLLLIDEFGFDRLGARAELRPAPSTIVCWTRARDGVRPRWRPISTSKRGPITWATRRWRRPFSTAWWTAR